MYIYILRDCCTPEKLKVTCSTTNGKASVLLTRTVRTLGCRPSGQASAIEPSLSMGSIVVPFCGLYLGSYKVIPKRNYLGAYGYLNLNQTSSEPERYTTQAQNLNPKAKAPHKPQTLNPTNPKPCTFQRCQPEFQDQSQPEAWHLKNIIETRMRTRTLHPKP